MATAQTWDVMVAGLRQAIDTIRELASAAMRSAEMALTLSKENQNRENAIWQTIQGHEAEFRQNQLQLTHDLNARMEALENRGGFSRAMSFRLVDGKTLVPEIVSGEKGPTWRDWCYTLATYVNTTGTSDQREAMQHAMTQVETQITPVTSTQLAGWTSRRPWMPS